MLTIELNMYHAVALGAFLFWMGGIITDKVRLLNRYCIPAPLVGGLCFSILNCILYSAGIASITFDGTLQTVFMILFFTTVGFTVSIPALLKGGKAVMLCLIVSIVMIPLQNFLGGGVMEVFGCDPLLGGGGVDGCIHRAAGPELLAECETLHGCETGSAKITKGYRLPCKYVIHAVGPRWYDGRHGERERLISCYQTSLMLAKEYGCESVAFPLISSGIFGYPKDQALKVAIDTISSFLLENEMTVYIVIFDRKAYQISGKLFADIAAYIDDRYVDEHTDSRSERLRRMSAFRMEEPMPCESSVCDEAIEKLTSPMAVSSEKAATLDDALEQIDESFSEMLLRKIDECGMTDAQCYKKANIDRKLFSKIRSDKSYKPSKPTVIAFAIALELPLLEIKDMLMKAGFALSHSNKFDIIVEYFVERGNYNVFEINEALFAFDQSLMGA